MQREQQSPVAPNDGILVSEILEAYPPDTEFSALDKLWMELAPHPENAVAKYQQNVESCFRRPAPSENLSPRWVTLASLGGIILAAEAGMPGADQSYKRIHTSANKLGHPAVLLCADVVSRGITKSEGSILPLYIVASAADDPKHTVWQPDPTFRAVKTISQGAATGARAVAGAAARKALPRLASAKKTPNKQQFPADRASDQVDRFAQSVLLARYNLNPQPDLVPIALASAYSEIAVRTGAAHDFQKHRGDLIARQRVVDFVGACLSANGYNRIPEGRRREEKIKEIWENLNVSLGKEVATFFDACTYTLIGYGQNVQVNAARHRGGISPSRSNIARRFGKRTVAVRPPQTATRTQTAADHKPSNEGGVEVMEEGPLRVLRNWGEKQLANARGGRPEPNKLNTTDKGRRLPSKDNLPPQARERVVARQKPRNSSYTSESRHSDLASKLSQVAAANYSGSLDQYDVAGTYAAAAMRHANPDHASGGPPSNKEYQLYRTVRETLAEDTLRKMVKDGALNNIAAGNADTTALICLADIRKWAAGLTASPRMQKIVKTATDALLYYSSANLGAESETAYNNAEKDLLIACAIYNSVLREPEKTRSAVMMAKASVAKAANDAHVRPNMLPAQVRKLCELAMR